jgi:hypothetical protein
MPRNDVVVDANIMCTLGTKAAGRHRNMFEWLRCCGSICVSQFVLNEYGRQGSQFVAGVLSTLLKEGRLAKIKNSTLNAFAALDRRYPYTCDTDMPVARTVFRSFRKLLISSDERLRNDVNGFHLLNGVKPRAVEVMEASDMVPRPHADCDIHLFGEGR